MPSFTTQVPNLREMGPVVQVRLAIGSALEDFLKKANQNLPAPIQVPAMIDTGATGTVVREDIINQLNLHPIGGYCQMDCVKLVCSRFCNTGK